jgi:hypothetical protein
MQAEPVYLVGSVGGEAENPLCTRAGSWLGGRTDALENRYTFSRGRNAPGGRLGTRSAWPRLIEAR